MPSPSEQPQRSGNDEGSASAGATPKQHLLEFVRQLPDDASFEEIRDEMVENLEYWNRVRALVEKSREDIEQGRTVSHEEAKKRFGIE